MFLFRHNRVLLTILLAIGMLFASTSLAYGTVISGQISNWPDGTTRMTIGDTLRHVTLWWSLNTLHKGYFYGHTIANTDSDVAFAAGVTNIAQITNASIFSFTDGFVGPLSDGILRPNRIGDFVVWRNITSGHYGVLRVDEIILVGQSYVLNGTWWFQTDGSGNFSTSSAVPTITSLSPASATAGGAAFTLTVNGTNFAVGAVVQWNGASRTTTFVSPIQLRATITSADIAAALTASVRVVNSPPGGAASATIPFIVSVNNPAPAITGVTPRSARAGTPGFNLVINGFNFLPYSQVRWNGVSLATVILSTRQLKSFIPASLLSSPSTATLTVTNPPPGGGVFNFSFSVTTPVPIVTALNPVEVVAGGPAFSLTVHGSRFLPASGFTPSAVVRWNGAERPTMFVSSTELVASIPATDIALASTAAITVANPGVSPSGQRVLPIVTLVPGGPRITSLDPSSIASGGPAFTLTVNGTGFLPGAIVRWNGSPRNTTAVNPTQLKAEITAADIATGTTFGISVVNPAPAATPNQQDVSESSNTSTGSVLNPFPVLSGFLPDSSPAGSSSMSLKATGAGFVSTTNVLWNGDSRDTTVVSGSQLESTITAPDLLSEGIGIVTASNPGPGGGFSSKTFTIVPATQPLTTLYFPRLSSSSTDPDQKYRETTGIALVNFDPSPTNVTLRALNPEGIAITAESLINPVTVSLGSEQIPITDTQLFGSELAAQNSLGWIKAESAVKKILGFFLAFSHDLSVLDGADVSSTAFTSFVFPEIEDQGFTQLHVANPGTQAATLTLELFKSDGVLRTAAVSRTVNPNGTLARFFTDLFPGITPSASDYLRVTSTRGVVPYEFLGKSGQYTHGVNGQDTAKGATILYSPQYVLQGSVWRTALSVVNLEETAGSITFRFIGDTGVQLGGTRTLTIEAKGKIFIDDSKFFLDAGGALVQGYVEITSSGPRLAGSVVFGDPSRSSFSSALPLVSTLIKDAVFGQVASNNTWFTGIALLNPNVLEAQATIDVLDSKGNLVRTKTEILPPKSRKSRLLTEYFSELTGQDITSGFIRVTVDREIATFALFGKNDLSALSAIPPQVVP